ncbi:MAG TPA: hypothetical protein VN207_12640, partial [Ktedonobacteraceae bacterium]|nr:hypothetical protein [Ktedonobacteraceae bacterium]
IRVVIHFISPCCYSFSFDALLALLVQPEESVAQVPSSVRIRSWRDAAECANNRRRTHNLSFDGLNQLIVGQSILLEMVDLLERVERKDVVVHLASPVLRAWPKVGLKP